MRNICKILLFSLLLTACHASGNKASLERKAEVLTADMERAIASGNMDSIWQAAQQDERVLFFVFDDSGLVFWSDNALSADYVPIERFDAWQDLSFGNADCRIRWTRCGAYNILTVIPLEWHIRAREEIGHSFSYLPLSRAEDTDKWWEASHARARVFQMIFIALFIVLAVIAVWMLVAGRGFKNMRLSYKFQLLFTLLVLFGFGFVFWGSIYYVHHHYRQQQRERLQERCRYAQASLQNLYYWDFMLSSSSSAGLNVDLRDLAYAFQTDIHVFDMNGRLVGSSTPQLFEKGLLSQHMAPEVFFSDEGTQIMDEHLGDVHYIAAYTEFYNGSNVQIGYIAMPSFISSDEMAREVDSYLARLLPAYLIVIILALLLSFLLSRHLIAPLSTVSERMRDLALGGKSNRIEYPYNDEIGELVRRYNDMVDELERFTRRLARSEREGAWRTMARQIAHEINNPLTPMKLTLQQLQRIKGSERFQEQFDRAATMLVEQIDTLSRIATSFSSFAKLPEVQVSEVDVAEKLSQAVSLQQNNTYNIPVRYVGPDSGIIVEADREQIGQVFTNILKNALQALEDRKNGDIIVILKQADDQWCEISISDNGPGIPEDIRPKIFMPNFTTKSTGTGLGLAISKNIVEGSDGKIRVETSDKGTTFYIYLRLPSKH